MIHLQLIFLYDERRPNFILLLRCMQFLPAPFDGETVLSLMYIL